MCVNVDGGYNCACYYGFTLGEDREKCERGQFQVHLVLQVNTMRRRQIYIQKIVNTCIFNKFKILITLAYICIFICDMIEIFVKDKSFFVLP